MSKKSRNQNRESRKNKYNLPPHQIDRALQLRLSQGLPGGDMLVLSRAYMERRVRQCRTTGSPYPIMRYHGWEPGSSTFSVSNMWKEEIEILREYGIEIDVRGGYAWRETIPVSELSQEHQDMYKKIVLS